MEIAIIVLSIAILFSLIIILRMSIINVKLRNENKELKDKSKKIVEEKKELLSIDPGDRAVIPDFGLVYDKGEKNEKSFTVTYEVEILEVSLDKVKVNAIDYSSNDSIANDPNHKQSIIDFMKNKWISKRDIELVVDNSMRRDAKLQEILK